MTRPEGENGNVGEAPEEMRTSITTTTMKKGDYVEKTQEETPPSESSDDTKED